MKIKELVLKNRLAARTPYTISNIIHNRKYFVHIEYN